MIYFLLVGSFVCLFVVVVVVDFDVDLVVDVPGVVQLPSGSEQVRQFVQGRERMRVAAVSLRFDVRQLRGRA